MTNKLLLVLAFSVLLAGCTDAIFGCPDRLIDAKPSPGNRFIAVTRECGCKAQSGTYLVTVIVRTEDDYPGCRRPAEAAIASIRTKTADGSLSSYWADETTLHVTPIGTDIEHVYNDPVYDFDFGADHPNVRAKRERTPRITVAEAGL